MMKKLVKTLTLAALFHLSLDHHYHVHLHDEKEYEQLHPRVAVTR